MDTTFIVIVTVVVLIVGSAIALWWWKLLRSIAPYKDEIGKPSRRDTENSEIVIITPPAAKAKD
jgi:hypothetical protein